MTIEENAMDMSARVNCVGVIGDIIQRKDKEYNDSITRIRLANFYRRLADAVNDEMSHGAIYAMHKDATELLKKLR